MTEREGTRELTLRSAEFRAAREYGWRMLDEIVSRAERRGISSLSAEDAQAIPLLYQSTVTSLSVARNIVLDRNLLLYLENLTLRAYLVVYGPRTGVLRNAASFFRRNFPRAVRAMRFHIAIIFAVLLAAAAAGFLLTMDDVEFYNTVVPAGLAGGRGPESTAEDLIRDELFAPWPGFLDSFVVFANSLFRNNAMVGILAFGLGFALGAPTVLLIAYNGLVLGAFVALHARLGLAVACLGWMSIHGVTEILAVILCGGAGLAVAERVIFPGEATRVESLARYGRQAASAAVGAVAMFFVAGMIEGGFRQLIASTPGRFAFAAATAVLWSCYFIFAGRQNDAGGD
jgi:uncharacterized membrane protein SpoIIM required for sporulation